MEVVVRWMYLWIIIVILFTVPSMDAAIRHVPGSYQYIQHAIAAARNGDTVLVADGTYTGIYNKNIDFWSKSILVTSESGPESCVIDCEFDGRGFQLDDDETLNSIINGFTIVNGFSYDGAGPAVNLWGTASGTIQNCIMENCSSLVDSGAIAVAAGHAMIFNCVIANNSTPYYGGGLTVNFGGTATVANCLFYGNESESGGGFACSHFSNVTFQNCTFADNTAEIVGGVGRCDPDTHVSLVSCILWGNFPDDITKLNDDLTLEYCDIETGYSGDGNIQLDPLFTTFSGNDYYLSHINAGQSATSPCIDTGNNTSDVICYDLVFGDVCLDEFTVRTDSVLDSGTVDMGFHFGEYLMPPMTPTPTATPIPPTPTKTPTPAATSTTGSPTSTPVMATNTPEPTPIDAIGLDLILEDRDLVQGDEFYLHYYLDNSSSDAYTADVWILMDVLGEYYCYPTWVNINSGVDYLENKLVASHGLYHEDILKFEWPAVDGALGGLFFYGASFDAGTFNIIGELRILEWQYH